MGHAYVNACLCTYDSACLLESLVLKNSFD